MKRFAILVAFLVAMPASAESGDWIPFDNSSGRLLFTIQVNGEEAVAMLATGTRTTAVSADTKLGIKDADLSLDFAGVNIEVDKVRKVVLSYADILIGQDTLNDYVIEIDYANQRLRVEDSKSARLKKSANVKMKRMSGTGFPVIRVDLAGDYAPWVIFDAGSTKPLSFTRERAEQRRWLEKFDSGKDGETPTFVVPELVVGPHTHMNAQARVSGYGKDDKRILAEGRNTGSRLSGTKVKLPEGQLGYEILSQYVVTIDFKRNLLRMVPAATATAEN